MQTSISKILRPPRSNTPQKLTDGPDDSLLQLPLLVSFDDLSADVGAAVIGAGQLIVHAETELPQEGVEHLQYCGPCTNTCTVQNLKFSKIHSESKCPSDEVLIQLTKSEPVHNRVYIQCYYISVSERVMPVTSPTEPLAAMAAASSKTSTIPARTVAEFLLLASR